MESKGAHDIRVAHSPVPVGDPGFLPFDRAAREAEGLNPGSVGRARGAATAIGAGDRAQAEEADLLRTCFERDLDRIKHSRPFRRLAGKCQVYIDPDDDHLRTRLTHAIEVAQVAVSIARAVGLDVALTEAAALGHDCGHGPAGHASEGALSPFVDGGYHHAVYGADVVLEPLNLCVETLDAVREHSWNRPGSTSAEGEVLAWADRIAYVCHDFEDAVSAGVVAPADLPAAVTEVVGADRRTQLHRFITAMVDTIAATGTVALRRTEADALDAFRQFNFERIYLRPAAVDQAEQVGRLIRQLTEFFIATPRAMNADLEPDSAPAVEAAVRWVSGMTDRFALDLAVQHLRWPVEQLPRGVLTGY